MQALRESSSPKNLPGKPAWPLPSFRVYDTLTKAVPSLALGRRAGFAVGLSGWRPAPPGGGVAAMRLRSLMPAARRLPIGQRE